MGLLGGSSESEVQNYPVIQESTLRDTPQKYRESKHILQCGWSLKMLYVTAQTQKDKSV